MKRTFLVTGGAGFIGSHLVQTLLERGDHVRVLDDFSSGRRQNLEQVEQWRGSSDYELIEADLRDPQVSRRAVEGVDCVLHQAAIPSVQRSVRDPEATNAVNVSGTLQLLECARQAKVKRFVLASSSSVYGESESLPKRETMPSEPISPYGLQKLAAETYALLYHRLYGLPTVALRYFNVFGPRQDPTSEYSAVIPLFITAVRSGNSPVIFGDGEQTRDFNFVSNVVQANLRACDASEEAMGKAYNVGCGERISLNQLLDEIGSLAGSEVKARYDEPRPGDIRHSLADIDRAATLLRYEPDVRVREGLARTFEAY